MACGPSVMAVVAGFSGRYEPRPKGAGVQEAGPLGSGLSAGGGLGKPRSHSTAKA